jgi:ATP-dependent Zn protease
MASERQIAANRRNAKKSTGPTTALGKKRSSKNAYTHGLSLPVRNAGSQKQIEELSQLFAGDASDARFLGLAETAADAQADLERVRQVKTAMLERAMMQTQGGNLAPPELLGSSGPLLIEEEGEQSFVNAVRHILPDLIKINRYEKRAESRRNRAFHELVSMKTANEK